eukprot:2624515-Rhodomonas_salina.2
MAPRIVHANPSCVSVLILILLFLRFLRLQFRVLRLGLRQAPARYFPPPPGITDEYGLSRTNCTEHEQ